jgi:DNA-binding beta-propeller fold protein YncE
VGYQNQEVVEKIPAYVNKSGYKEALFSPNGQFLVIIRDDNTVDVLDPKTNPLDPKPKALYTLPKDDSSKDQNQGC